MKTIDVDLNKYAVLQNREDGLLYATEKEVWESVWEHRRLEYKKGTNSSMPISCSMLHFDKNTDTYSLTQNKVEVESANLDGIFIKIE